MKEAKSVIEFHKIVKLQETNETRVDSFRKLPLPRENITIEDEFDANKPTIGINVHFYKSELQIRCRVGNIEIAENKTMLHKVRTLSVHTCARMRTHTVLSC